MSDTCHVCGQNPQECPTVICAPCALAYRPVVESGTPVRIPRHPFVFTKDELRSNPTSLFALRELALVDAYRRIRDGR